MRKYRVSRLSVRKTKGHSLISSVCTTITEDALSLCWLPLIWIYGRSSVVLMSTTLLYCRNQHESNTENAFRASTATTYIKLIIWWNIARLVYKCYWIQLKVSLLQIMNCVEVCGKDEAYPKTHNKCHKPFKTNFLNTEVSVYNTDKYTTSDISLLQLKLNKTLPLTPVQRDMWWNIPDTDHKWTEWPPTWAMSEAVFTTGLLKKEATAAGAIKCMGKITAAHFH
jgi:hypothetical protein